ncbi:MAG: thiamine phosphate synthase [Candidatus Omnitrophica bacterium]|nr:thiamine phosphate synthase [Candidatus Omnitrophota bacterium]
MLRATTSRRGYLAKSPRERLATSNGVYLILDKPKFYRFSLKKIRSLVAGKKVGLIQLRDKYGSKSDVLKFAIRLAKEVASTKTLFIINDYVDIAFAAKADGVHLGQGDLSLIKARKILGKNKIIGISCHNLSQALKAQEEGADYIGIGPIYATATKPGYKAIGLKAAAELKTKIKIPYFAIGNIHEGNIEKVSAAGIRRVAVCRAILEAKNPNLSVKGLYKKLKKYDTT